MLAGQRKGSEKYFGSHFTVRAEEAIEQICICIQAFVSGLNQACALVRSRLLSSPWASTTCLSEK